MKKYKFSSTIERKTNKQEKKISLKTNSNAYTYKYLYIHTRAVGFGGKSYFPFLPLAKKHKTRETKKKINCNNQESSTER